MHVGTQDLLSNLQRITKSCHMITVCSMCLIFLQDQEQQSLGRNALHALMGLEVNPIKAGGLKNLCKLT